MTVLLPTNIANIRRERRVIDIRRYRAMTVLLVDKYWKHPHAQHTQLMVRCCCCCALYSEQLGSLRVHSLFRNHPQSSHVSSNTQSPVFCCCCYRFQYYQNSLLAWNLWIFQTPSICCCCCQPSCYYSSNNFDPLLHSNLYITRASNTLFHY